MTRFARAKGSKASNEKAPEESTPWEVMKEQLIQSKKENEEMKKRQEAEKQRMENYQSFLNDHKTQKRKAQWCEFPETAEKNVYQPIKKKKVGVKNKKASTSVELNNTHNSSIAEDTSESKKNKNNNKSMTVSMQVPGPSVELNNTINIKIAEDSSEFKKKNKKRKNKNKSMTNSMQDPGPSVELINTSNINIAEDSSEIKKKKKKKKNKNKSMPVSMQDSSPSVSAPQNELNQDGQIKEKQKSKKTTKKVRKESIEPEGEKNDISKNDKPSDKNNKNPNKLKQRKKKKKLVNGQPARRKEINDNSFQLIINGKEVELLRFDGFPIMKKDAERLKELKDNMIKKGIPKSEVQRTMKLERRRAEKALARLKKDVCYNCRKGGHNLSDCPDLKSKLPGVDAADGVCFKCGSTEHKQFECKVQKNMEFKFATCFICKQPGHIARQCPDNPKGLYPNGGSCKLCGDVTHLRKDCPSANTKKEETSIKLDTLNSDNIEDITQQTSAAAQKEGNKKPKKIKF